MTMRDHDEMKRRAKCVRCSDPIGAEHETVLTPEREPCHPWCAQVIASQALRRHAETIEKSRATLERRTGQAAWSPGLVAIPDAVALRAIHDAGAICAACLALDCDVSLDAARVTLGVLRVAGQISLSEGECYFCVRTLPVARLSALEREGSTP